MNVINDAYFNEKDQKLWKTGEQQLRISSVEQVKGGFQSLDLIIMELKRHMTC